MIIIGPALQILKLRHREPQREVTVAVGEKILRMDWSVARGFAPKRPRLWQMARTHPHWLNDVLPDRMFQSVLQQQVAPSNA